MTRGALGAFGNTATVDGDLLGLAADELLEECHLEIRHDRGVV